MSDVKKKPYSARFTSDRDSIPKSVFSIPLKHQLFFLLLISIPFLAIPADNNILITTAAATLISMVYGLATDYKKTFKSLAKTAICMTIGMIIYSLSILLLTHLVIHGSGRELLVLPACLILGTCTLAGTLLSIAGLN